MRDPFPSLTTKGRESYTKKVRRLRPRVVAHCGKIPIFVQKINSFSAEKFKFNDGIDFIKIEFFEQKLRFCISVSSSKSCDKEFLLNNKRPTHKKIIIASIQNGLLEGGGVASEIRK